MNPNLIEWVLVVLIQIYSSDVPLQVIHERGFTSYEACYDAGDQARRAYPTKKVAFACIEWQEK